MYKNAGRKQQKFFQSGTHNNFYKKKKEKRNSCISLVKKEIIKIDFTEEEIKKLTNFYFKNKENIEKMSHGIFTEVIKIIGGDETLMILCSEDESYFDVDINYSTNVKLTTLYKERPRFKFLYDAVSNYVSSIVESTKDIDIINKDYTLSKLNKKKLENIESSNIENKTLEKTQNSTDIQTKNVINDKIEFLENKIFNMEEEIFLLKREIRNLKKEI